MVDHYAYYGNVRMEKVFCNECNAYSFVLNGETICCDSPVEKVESRPFKVVIAPEVKRKTPSQYEKANILESQGGKCFYCDLPFGSVVWDNNKKKARILKINWDHFTPFAYSLNNKSSNFVASCNICNSLKSAKVFDTVEEAKLYMKKRWSDKNIFV